MHINSDDTLCINQPFEVSFTLQPGTFTHQILSDGLPGNSQDTNIILYYLNQYTNYIAVVVWNNTYCSGYSDTVHVVFSPPVHEPLIPGVNGNIVYANDPSLNYQWYLDGIAIPGANNDTLLMTPTDVIAMLPELLMKTA